MDIDLCYLPLSGRDEAFRIKFAKNSEHYRSFWSLTEVLCQPKKGDYIEKLT